MWIPTARSSSGRETAKKKGIEGGTSEVCCGLRQDNSRKGNSKEEWVREVGAWVGGRTGISLRPRGPDAIGDQVQKMGMGTEK